MRVLSVILGFIAVAGLLFGSQPAGDPFKPGKLPKAQQAALVTGLAAEFLGADTKAAPLDVQRVRLAALFVPAGQAPTPFVTGPYSIRYTGYLKAAERGDYVFKAVVLGELELRVNDKEALRAKDTTAASPPGELARGYNKIEIRYHPPAKGDAKFRVSWSGESFNEEPLPPDALFTRGDQSELVKHSDLRDGRLSFAAHDCTRCHELPAGIAASADKMPELSHQAPSLEGAGSRFGRGWLVQWITNPRELRPGATMPAVLHGATAADDARDIATYLAGLKTHVAAAPEGVVADGEKLYAKLGCVACHHFEDPKKADELDRYPLGVVGKKLNADSLFAFLESPTRHYAWIRMPDFKLSDEEAANLVAYILDQAKGTVPEAPAGSAERGAKRFAEVGCANCHVLKTGTTPKGTALRKFPTATAKGCLAEADAERGFAPDYGFTKPALASLRAFLASDTSSLGRDRPVEFSRREVVAMKCNACHRRDGATSRWYTVLEEEGTLPEGLPVLTWTGEKLHPEWTKKLLAGEQDHRARPWLKARMPAFPARAGGIAIGLSHEHGFAPNEDNAPPPNAELALVGKKLLPQVGGLNCVQCHGIGKQPPVAPFEAPGINLLDAAYRIRYDYYQRWMLDPPRVDLTTKMPQLAMDGKTTGIRDVYDGDARRQFDALWQFIQTLPKTAER
ncbi:MAG TPA: c-type cytochrome [Gemmataceae bacterium]|nr:c-type cytochrome [Gemmataceae bacterium]